MKLWQGRIDAPSSSIFESFSSSVAQDSRLAPYDIAVSRAHARGLAEAGIITPDEADQLCSGLDEIEREVEAGTVTWRDDLEDVHTHVEVWLGEKVGELAGKLHTGRSRNDQIATDLRLFVKDATVTAMDAVLAVQAALLGLAERYASALMPGYTHLQQAQPVVIAQPLLAHASMLGRDWERLRDAFTRTDLCPLGCGAFAGAAFPLNRRFTARLLGFAGIVENSIDGVSDRDFLVEFVSAAALCMTHLSRLAEDIVLWSSVEFGYLRLPDAFASGSSMMPQKKNPDAAELIRGKTALAIGDVAGALALVKGIPLAYNRDLQEDKTPLFHASDTVIASLRLMAAMIPELEFDTDRTESAISSFTLATDLADYLVSRGMPFREAHGVVGQLVQDCLRQGRALTDLTPQDLAAASPLLGGEIELSARASVARKATAGSTNPAEVAAQIEKLRDVIAERTGA